MARTRSIPFLLAVVAVAVQACSGAGASDAPAASAASSAAKPGAPEKRSGPFAFLRSHRKVETLAAGAEIRVQARDEISSRTAHAGDAVVVTSSAPAVNAAGDTVIPAGAELEGTITDIAPAPNPRASGRLAMDFSTVRFGGKSYPLHARLVAADAERVGRGIPGGTALKGGGGAAIGGLAGRLIGGNTTGAVIGAAAGAAAGGVYAHETRTLDVVLPRGGAVRIALTEPFQP